VQLMPDAALCLGPLARPGHIQHDTVFLLRTDDEQRGYDLTCFKAASDAILVDWLAEPLGPIRLARLEHRLRRQLSGKGRSNTEKVLYYRRLAEIRVRRGLELLARGRTVVTDRLHAHILSFLMDIPHVALDNDYGKVSGFIHAWTAASPLVSTATDPSGAMHARDELASLVKHGSIAQSMSPN
jgi:pyruvyl transferase EpsO